MSLFVRNILSAGLVTAVVSLAQINSVSANDSLGAQAQCQSQADEYGIEPEQRDVYIYGCIMSMGGVPDMDQNPETGQDDTSAVTTSPDAE